METSAFRVLRKVQEDQRTGPGHISLMAAILALWEERRPATILVTGKTLRRSSRINSKGTYYKYIADLQRFGYIGYEPTRSGKRESRIRVLD